MDWLPIENTAQLSGLLQYVRIEMEARGSGSTMFADVQAITGLRSAEVLDKARWNEVSDNTYSVFLAKGSGVRVIDGNTLPDTFRKWLTRQNALYEYTYRAYDTELVRPGIIFKFNGNKKATLSHAFRYCKFRELAAQGMSVADIQAYMSHTSMASTLIYLNDAAYYAVVS